MAKKAIAMAFVLIFVFAFLPASGVANTNRTQRLPILLYHHLAPEAYRAIYWDNNGAVISVENFEAQMSYLYRNNFHTVSLDELYDFLFNGVPLPPRSVMIQFDDGYYSNFVYALPILERYGFVAQLFLLGERIHRMGDTQPPINNTRTVWTAAATIEGTEHVFETANHTFDKHRRIEGTNISAFVYYDIDEVRDDFIRASYLVNDHRAFAYPMGQYSPETIEMLEDLGISMAFIVGGGYATQQSDNMRLPRFPIWPDTTISRFSDLVRGRR